MPDLNLILPSGKGHYKNFSLWVPQKLLGSKKTYMKFFHQNFVKKKKKKSTRKFCEFIMNFFYFSHLKIKKKKLEYAPF